MALRFLMLQESFKNLFTWDNLIGPITWIEVVQKLIAEFIGTAILVILGCWTLGIIQYLQADSLHLNNSFGFGMAVLVVIVITGHISYACVNPAVTLTFVIIGIIKPGLGILYIVIQCLGAIVSAAIVYGLAEKFRGDNANFCCTKVVNTLEVWQGFCIEMIATGILCLAVCAAFDERNAKFFDSLAIKLGLIVMVLALAVGPFTGCSMNPARSLGPAVIANFWENHWVYWLGPLSGSLTAAVFYRFVLFVPKPKKQKEEDMSTVITDSSEVVEELQEEKEE